MTSPVQQMRYAMGFAAAILAGGISSPCSGAPVRTVEIRPVAWDAAVDPVLLPIGFREGARSDIAVAAGRFTRGNESLPSTPLAVIDPRGGATSRTAIDETVAPRQGLELPEPGRFSGTIATLALALFFFVRRLSA